MSTIFDQVAYILENYGTQPRSKLFRLLYLCQISHIIRHDEYLFALNFEIRESCPVVLELYDVIKHRTKVSVMLEGDAREVESKKQQTIDYVMETWACAPALEIMEAVDTDHLYKTIWKRSEKRMLSGKGYAKMTPEFIQKNHRGDRWKKHMHEWLGHFSYLK